MKAAIAIVLALAPSLAEAQTETSSQAYVFPTEGARTISWYGWETLSFDATFGVALLASAGVLAWQRQREVWLIPIGLPYIVATPIAHGVHDNLAAALISGALRIVLPAATFAVLRAICDGEFCRDSGVANQVGLWSGFVISLVLTPLVDAALFAWEEREYDR